MTQKRKAIGKWGEEIALCFLKKKRLRILFTNYRCKFGEIDIIARDKKTLLFIEVKTRTSCSYGSPQESIHPRKQAQISKVALAFIQRYRLENWNARFDVIAIQLLPKGYSIEHIQNAFDLNIF